MVPPLQPLLERGGRTAARQLASDGVNAFYGAPLWLPEGRPAPVIANFVATIDGVTTFARDDARGAAMVSGGSAEDRLLMAMLRAAADVILVGAATLRVTRNHRWIPDALAGDLSEELRQARRRATGSVEPPALAVVSAGGDLPVDHPALRVEGAQTLVITTTEGARRLAGSRLRLSVAAAAGPISPEAVMEVIQRELGPRLVLTEGGPRLLGTLLSAGLVEELFLTVSPLLAGRSPGTTRPGLVDGFEAEAEAAPRAELISVRCSQDGHLFLRYGLAR